MPAIRLLTVFLLLAAGPVRADSLVLLTENLPPFSMAAGGGNFAKDDAVQGLSSDVVRGMCRRAAVDCQLILRFPWDRLYQQTLSDAGYGLFSTIRTPEREALFKWVGPIATSDWVLLARGDSTLQVDNLQQAAAYRIGGYRNDAISQYLIDRGLEVQTSLQDKENLGKLDKGQIDLWATDGITGRYQARQAEMDALRVVHRFNSADLYLALNVATPDELVRKLQQALEQMRSEGELRTITAAYQE